MLKNWEISDAALIEKGQGLVYQGTVTTYTDSTHFACLDLASFGNDFFCNSSYSDWEVYALWDVGGAGAAPQGLLTPVSDYVSSTGTFTHTAFASGTLAVGDKVLLVHPILAILGTKADAAAAGAVTSADSAAAYIKQTLNELLGTDGGWTNLSGAAIASLDAALQAIAAVVGLDGANTYSASVDGSARTTMEAAIVALAALIGTKASTAAAGAVTTADDIVAYIKQIVNDTYKLYEVSDTDQAYPATLADHSILASIMTSDGDASGYDRATDSLEAISDAVTVVDGIVDVIDNVLTPNAGVHFWVDSVSGNDSNSGLSAGDPVLTYTYALSLVTAGRYDVIHGMANSPSAPPATETFPIVVNKTGVTIRGEHGKGLLSDSGIGSDEQNVATFEIAASYVTIEDMYLGCDNLGTTGGIIEFNSTNSYFGVTIRRCTFDTQYIAAYGILATYDQPYLLVEDCLFGRSDIACYTTAGIYLGNCTSGMIRKNVFASIAGIGISCGGGCGNLSILENRFRLPSDTAGKAITLAAGSSGIFVDGNHANFGGVPMVNNPYADASTANYNDWGTNHKGGVPVNFEGVLAGITQVKTMTWDLLRGGGGAGTDVLLTGTTQAVILESLIIRMPITADITDGDPITSLAIATDDAEPGVILAAADCPVASLTPESQFSWIGSLYIPVGTEIEGTLAGGDADAECLVIVTATYRAVVSGGYLA